VPFISVIITAYNRKKFLPYALKSLESQTLPKDKFEVIVVKNFEDQISDGIIRKNGWKDMVTNVIPLGGKIAIGLEESKGDIITFLEDDDLYREDRLEKIYKTFKSVPELIYFHNKQIYIDESGRPLTSEYGNEKSFIIRLPPSLDLVNKIILNNKGQIVKTKITDVKNFHPPINSSSITVKKEIFYKSILDKIGNIFASVDVLLFYLAYCRNGNFVFDNRKLTLRRIHRLNTSVDRVSDYEDWLNNLSRISKLYTTDHLTFLNIFSFLECEIPNENKKKLISQLEAMYLGWKVTYSRLPNTKNELTLKELIKYLRYQRGLKSFLQGFLPLAPKKIKGYAIKKWYKYNLSVMKLNDQ